MRGVLRLPRDPRAAFALVVAFVAGADMALALGYWALQGVDSARIVKGIAAGWVGREAARAGGVEMVWLGAITHVSLAAAMVAAYLIASWRFALLTTRPVLCGLAYGIASWAAMMFVVIPLSALGGGGSPDPVWRMLHLSSHLFVVGLPSAWLARALHR